MLLAEILLYPEPESVTTSPGFANTGFIVEITGVPSALVIVTV